VVVGGVVMRPPSKSVGNHITWGFPLIIIALRGEFFSTKHLALFYDSQAFIGYFIIFKNL